MKKFLFVLIFLLVTPIALWLAILWCASDIWRVYIEREAEIVFGGMKE